MKKTIALIVLFCTFLLTGLYAQKEKQPKYTRKEFIKDSIAITQPPIFRPQLRLDNRHLFLKGSFTTMNGFDAGVMLKNRIRVAAGYYWMDDIMKPFNVLDDGTKISRNLRMNYVGLNFDFIFRNTRYYNLSIPFELGYGSQQLRYYNPLTEQVYSDKKGGMFITDFGLSGTLKPVRFIGLKASVGYRTSFINPIDDINLNCMYLSIGCAVDIYEILKDYRMYSIKRKYKRNFDKFGTAIDLIMD